MSSQQKRNIAIGYVDFFIIALSVYVLGAIAAETFLELPLETHRVLEIIDDAICVFFLAEFCWRFYKAPNKIEFMKWGWIDLLSSIPNLDVLRFGRALRVIRLFRLIRAFRSTRHLIHYVYANKAQGVFATASLAALLMILFSSIAILQVETDPQSNIRTAGDALWWSYTTITTVGYGDRYPVTFLGRLIAMALMTAGVGLFGTFTGLVSSWFLTHDTEKENIDTP